MKPIHSVTSEEVAKKLPITFQFGQLKVNEKYVKKSKVQIPYNRYSTHYKPIVKMKKT